MLLKRIFGQISLSYNEIEMYTRNNDDVGKDSSIHNKDVTVWEIMKNLCTVWHGS